MTYNEWHAAIGGFFLGAFVLGGFIGAIAHKHYSILYWDYQNRIDDFSNKHWGYVKPKEPFNKEEKEEKC